jgi:hypothetical protein
MDLDAASLSALASSLRDLTDRVTAIAEGYQGQPREDAIADLYDVERHLNAATRRLEGLLSRL